MDDAKPSRALDQSRVLIDIGRNLAEISPSGCCGNPNEARI
jgi:hypothetical protein